MNYIFIGLLLLLSSCKNGPKVTICVVDVAKNGYQCVDKNKKESFLPFKDSDNYVAVSPNDVETLLNYCKVSKADANK